MATKTNKKFGVVHGAPSQLLTTTLDEGKLYFIAGEASGNVKQGIYGVNGVTTDTNGNISTDIAMFACGAVADGIGFGLSQYNFDSTYKTKLDNLDTNYLKTTDYVQVGKDSSGYVPMADSNVGTIDSQTGDWVLAWDGSKVDWFKLPENAFKNDDTTYTGTAPINVDGTTISHANSGVTAGGYGDTSAARTLDFGDKFKVVDVSVNEFGHITKAASYELTLPSKPNSAGTADKVASSLTIKGNGTTVGTFDGSAEEEVNIKSGNAQTLTVTGTADGSITITPVTAAVALDSNALTTGAQVADYINTQLGNLSGALVYKGTVASANTLPNNASTGHVYVASASFVYNDGSNNWNVESGDMFIYNGTKWNIVNGENQVVNGNNGTNATLTPGTNNVKIATVDGTDIKVDIPALPSIVNTLNGKSGTLTTSYDSSNFAADSSYRLGTLTIAEKTHVIYGKDTIYVHPVSINGTENADSSLKSTTATSLSHEGTFTVATGVYRDASGHISKVETETFKLPEQYEHPAVGTTNTAVDMSVLTAVTLNSSTSFTVVNNVYRDASGHTNKVSTTTYTMPASAFTDEKVKANTSTGKVYLVGQDDSTNGTTEVVYKNASVYMQAGKMYATTGDISTSEAALVTAAAVKDAIEDAQEAATIYWETL